MEDLQRCDRFEKQGPVQRSQTLATEWVLVKGQNGLVRRESGLIEPQLGCDIFQLSTQGHLRVDGGELWFPFDFAPGRLCGA
jgi:hypothetical protein